jgi:hypothetical protein
VNPTDVPFVSMIVPVRNEAAGIEACLGSLRDRTLSLLATAAPLALRPDAARARDALRAGASAGSRA